MPRARLDLGDLWIEAIQPAHIEPIRQWRNAQIDVLRQSSIISPEQQRAYYEQHIWPDQKNMQPRNILVAIHQGDDFIGYGGLVHIAWEHRRAELSFLLDTTLTSDINFLIRTFGTFLELMKVLAFEDLGLQRLSTETYAMRKHHIDVLEESGFRREGVLKQHVIIDGEPVDSILHGCLASYGNRPAT